MKKTCVHFLHLNKWVQACAAVLAMLFFIAGQIVRFVEHDGLVFTGDSKAPSTTLVLFILVLCAFAVYLFSMILEFTYLRPNAYRLVRSAIQEKVTDDFFWEGEQVNYGFAYDKNLHRILILAKEQTVFDLHDFSPTRTGVEIFQLCIVQRIGAHYYKEIQAGKQFTQITLTFADGETPYALIANGVPQKFVTAKNPYLK